MKTDTTDTLWYGIETLKSMTSINSCRTNGILLTIKQVQYRVMQDKFYHHEIKIVKVDMREEWGQVESMGCIKEAVTNGML